MCMCIQEPRHTYSYTYTHTDLYLFVWIYILIIFSGISIDTSTLNSVFQCSVFALFLITSFSSSERSVHSCLSCIYLHFPTCFINKVPSQIHKPYPCLKQICPGKYPCGSFCFCLYNIQSKHFFFPLHRLATFFPILFSLVFDSQKNSLSHL